MIKRILISFVSAILASVLFAGTVLAAWTFMFPIYAYDTSNVTRTYYPVMLGFGGQSLVDSGKINSSGNDTNLQIGGSDIDYMMSTTNCVAIIPVIPAGGVSTMSLYTGYTPQQSGFPIITGDGGYVSVSDNTDIEWGDYFECYVDGYFKTDADSGKYFAYKQGAVELFVSDMASENVTCIVYGNATTAYLLPNGSGNYTNIPTLFGAATHWEAVDDPVGVPDEDATYVADGDNGQTKDAYNLQDLSIDADSIVNSVTVHFRTRDPGATGGVSDQPFLRLSVNETAGTLNARANAAYATQNETLARPGGGSWSVADINNLQVAIGLTGNTGLGDSIRCTQIYVSVNYNPAYRVTVPDMTEGEHTATVATDNNSLYLGITKDKVDADFPVTDNMNVGMPLWHPECSSNPFTTKDLNEYWVDVTGAVWSTDIGYTFDGNDLLSISDNANLTFAGAFSIVAWIKTNTTSKGIASKYGAAAPDREWLFRPHTAGKLEIYLVHADSANYLNTVGTYNTADNVWHQVIATWNGTNNTGTIKFYVDGNSDAVSSDTKVGAGYVAHDGTANVTVGSFGGGSYFVGNIGEVQIYDRALSPTEVTTIYNATKWKYDGSDEYMHYNLLPAGGVLDNANDWVLLDNSSDLTVPYASNVTMSVNGTLQMYLCPTGMLSGATIPDRAGGDNPGTIHWGSNTNLSMSYGEMSSYESYLATINTTGGFGVPAASMPSTWFAAGGSVASLPFYDSFSNVSVQTGQPVQVLYFLAIIGVAFGAFIGITSFSRSALAGYIAMVAIFGIGSSMTIVPAWIVFTMIVIGTSIMYLYKQVSY